MSRGHWRATRDDGRNLGPRDVGLCAGGHHRRWSFCEHFFYWPLFWGIFIMSYNSPISSIQINDDFFFFPTRFTKLCHHHRKSVVEHFITQIRPLRQSHLFSFPFVKWLFMPIAFYFLKCHFSGTFEKKKYFNLEGVSSWKFFFSSGCHLSFNIGLGNILLCRNYKLTVLIFSFMDIYFVSDFWDY